jgi:hypothetical protein
MSDKLTIEDRIDETLKDFKALLPRYRELKSDRVKLKLFFSRNRNPIWDLSSNKLFKTGLKSDKLINEGGESVEDHYIQRTKAMRLIFAKIDGNPNITTEEFTNILLGISSTVSITKSEHSLVTGYAKQNDMLNYQAYKSLGIKIEGFIEYLESKNILV